MAHTIKQLINTVLPKESGWKQHLLANWPMIIGKLYTKVTIESIYDNSLVLGVYDSCWLQELYMLSSVIIKQINEKLDQPRIKKVCFKQVGPVLKKEITIKKIEIRSLKTISLSNKEKDALKCIADPDLQAALTSYLIRCYQEKE